MGWSLSKSVWDRVDGFDNMSSRTYILAVTGFTVLGMLLCMFIAYNTMHWQPTSLLTYLGIGLGLPIIGILIALRSQNWLISLLGYILVVTGLGAITGPTVALYQISTVINALAATCGVTLVMSLIGILYPKSLQHWSGYLLGALLALLFVRIAQMIIISLNVATGLWYLPIIEYGGAVLFSLFIIYDWNRAVRLPHNLDNAVDSALAIFLDILNLFLHLLRIMGGRGSSK